MLIKKFCPECIFKIFSLHSKDWYSSHGNIFVYLLQRSNSSNFDHFELMSVLEGKDDMTTTSPFIDL